jgi:hypothetical protein
MRDEDEDLVYERGSGYVGDTCVVSGRTLFALLRHCAISEEIGSEVGGFERYSINSTGRELLAASPETSSGKKGMEG